MAELRGKDYCGCDHALHLMDVITNAWVELALPRTPKEIAVDKILREALEGNQRTLIEHLTGEI